MKKLLLSKSAPLILSGLVLLYVLSLIYTFSMMSKVSFDTFNKNFAEAIVPPSISSGALRYSEEKELLKTEKLELYKAYTSEMKKNK
ncbi:MAG: hypothetical protein HRT68_14445 [Flavobacteriaceae bacterium]|nr:hypothetical protein [Flavobacteriaceae bacterium]